MENTPTTETAVTAGKCDNLKLVIAILIGLLGLYVCAYNHGVRDTHQSYLDRERAEEYASFMDVLSSDNIQPELSNLYLVKTVEKATNGEASSVGAVGLTEAWQWDGAFLTFKAHPLGDKRTFKADNLAFVLEGDSGVHLMWPFNDKESAEIKALVKEIQGKSEAEREQLRDDLTEKIIEILFNSQKNIDANATRPERGVVFVY